MNLIFIFLCSNDTGKKEIQWYFSLQPEKKKKNGTFYLMLAKSEYVTIISNITENLWHLLSQQVLLFWQEVPSLVSVINVYCVNDNVWQLR